MITISSIYKSTAYSYHLVRRMRDFFMQVATTITIAIKKTIPVTKK